MELPQRLSSLRKASKAPLRAVSMRCGCSSQYLHKLETGQATRPALEILYKLAAYYQFPADQLIIEAGKIPQDVYWKIIQNPHILPFIRNFQR